MGLVMTVPFGDRYLLLDTYAVDMLEKEEKEILTPTKAHPLRQPSQIIAVFAETCATERTGMMIACQFGQIRLAV